jgi:hypothetical protein
VPPNGTDETNSRSPAAVDASASPGSSSLDRDATRRFTASRSRSSSRPNVNSTFGTARPFTGSHSLWARCRYRTVPDLFSRFVVFTYTTPDSTEQLEVSAGESAESRL